MSTWFIVLRLTTFGTHLNVRKGKYSKIRNRLSAGKAGPPKIIMFEILHIIYSSRKLPAFSNASCRLPKVTNLLHENKGLFTFVSFFYFSNLKFLLYRLKIIFPNLPFNFLSLIFLIWNFYYIGLRLSFQIYRSISYPGHIWKHSFSFDYCKTCKTYLEEVQYLPVSLKASKKSVRHLLFTCWSCTLNGFKLRLLMQIKHVHFLIKLLRSL